MESRKEKENLEFGENSKNTDNGSLREVASVSWPIVVSMLSYTAMGVTDTLFVGWIGTTELAAVGLASTVFFLFNSFFFGSIHGVKVLAAQATGAKQHKLAELAAWQGFFLAIPFGAAVIALSSFSEGIFALMGGTAAVQGMAAVYFGVRVWGAPFGYVAVAAGDYFQGIGDTKTPMKVNLFVNAANIVLDVVLIFGLGPIPAMGVHGAALATVIASALGMVLMSTRFVERVGFHAQLSLKVMEKVLRLGVPMGVRYVLNVAGFTVFTAIVARMGEAALAAHQIAFKIISISFLPGYGISEATSILTGQYVGAGEPSHAKRSYRNAMKLSVGMMGVFGAVFWIFPEVLIGVFQSDPEVLRIGSQLLILAALFQVFDAVAMTGIGALNGTGDTRFTMLMSVGCSWFIMVPTAYFFGVELGYGTTGAWVGIVFEVFALAIIAAWRFHSERWVRHSVV